MPFPMQYLKISIDSQVILLTADKIGLENSSKFALKSPDHLFT